MCSPFISVKEGHMNLLEKRIYDVVLPLVEKQGLILFSVEEVKEDGLKILRVLVDADHIIDVEEVTKIIEPLQEIVESEDLIPDEYYLEVSSVGIEKPLRNFEEIKNAVSKYIFVELKEVIENDNSHYGTLKETDDLNLYLEINKKGRMKKIVIPYEKVKFARIAIKF